MGLVSQHFVTPHKIRARGFGELGLGCIIYAKIRAHGNRYFLDLPVSTPEYAKRTPLQQHSAKTEEKPDQGFCLRKGNREQWRAVSDEQERIYLSFMNRMGIKKWKLVQGGVPTGLLIPHVTEIATIFSMVVKQEVRALGNACETDFISGCGDYRWLMAASEMLSIFAQPTGTCGRTTRGYMRRFLVLTSKQFKIYAIN